MPSLSGLPLSAAALLACSALLLQLAGEAAGRAGVASAMAPEVATDRAGVPMPAVHLDWHADRGLRVWGMVPDEATRTALVQHLRAVYGAAVVQDELRTAPVASPNWLDADFLPDLRGAEQASASLADGRLALQGTLPDAGARARLLAAVAPHEARRLPVLHQLQIVR